MGRTIASAVEQILSHLVVFVGDLQIPALCFVGVTRCESEHSHEVYS